MGRRSRTRKINLRDNKKTVLITVAILLFILLFFSIIFSLINIGNNKVVHGVKIGNIDVSGLTKEQLAIKMENWYKDVVQKNILVTYKDLEETINPEQLEIKANSDLAIIKACEIRKIRKYNKR